MKRFLLVLFVAVALTACRPSLSFQPMRCQREEHGEVVGYLPGSTPRPGFPAVRCPR